MKVIKWIGIALIACGFLLMLGTAGTSDVDAICFDMAIVCTVLGLVMVCGGCFAIYFIEKKENN